jgi:MOSC domain-containing protein YiiM
LDHFQAGLTTALLGRDDGGKVIRKAGIMSMVVSGGDVRPGDSIKAELPPLPFEALDRV